MYSQGRIYGRFFLSLKSSFTCISHKIPHLTALWPQSSTQATNGLDDKMVIFVGSLLQYTYSFKDSFVQIKLSDEKMNLCVSDTQLSDFHQAMGIVLLYVLSTQWWKKGKNTNLKKNILDKIIQAAKVHSPLE